MKHCELCGSEVKVLRILIFPESEMLESIIPILPIYEPIKRDVLGELKEIIEILQKEAVELAENMSNIGNIEESKRCDARRGAYLRVLTEIKRLEEES